MEEVVGYRWHLFDEIIDAEKRHYYYEGMAEANLYHLHCLLCFIFSARCFLSI
jgi:hypothetical protein